MSDHSNESSGSNPRPGLRNSWQWTSIELKKALDDWQGSAEKAQVPVPDEKILAGMQNLLKEIKHQMDELCKTTPPEPKKDSEPDQSLP